MTKTLIIFLLDESSSMHLMREEICKGYNDLLEKQYSIKEDEIRLCLIKFNTRIKVYKAAKYGRMTRLFPWKSNYEPSGSTALYKAVSKAISIGGTTKQHDERIIFITIVYGTEMRAFGNCWKIKLRSIFKAKKETEKWTILYIGKNALKWSEDTGLDPSDTIEFNHVNPLENFKILNSALTKYRLSKDFQSINLFNL